MNEIWSRFVQTSEELYQSRSLRFNYENRSLWLSAIGAKSGDSVLEVGSAGGAFCHRLKRYIKDVTVTGLDRDTAHIAYAREKTRELGLECEFIEGDATAMPFADGTFDVCFSHTVAEHIPHAPFFLEQRRVLKEGGRIAVLSVRTKLAIRGGNYYLGEGRERELMEKAWSEAGGFEGEGEIGAYEMDEHEYPKELEQAGFRAVDVSVFSTMDYAPDNASTSREQALAQINCRRLSCLASVDKAQNLAPHALTDAEREELRALINARFDKRAAQYLANERLWDFSSVTVLVASGIK